MGTGATGKMSVSTGPRRCSQAGFSFVESLVTLAIVGALSMGIGSIDLERNSLAVAQTELRATLDQAFHLAHQRGISVKVMAKDSGSKALAPDVLPLQLPRRVRWGKPASIPLPKGMDEPIQADDRGEAHPTITVSPRHTVTATTWFLNDGREAICMRLSGQGQMTLLRWKQNSRKWVRV